MASQPPNRAEFDARVRSELRSIPVPPGLRAQILSAGKPASLISVRFWRPALALAAAIAVIAAGLFLSQRPSAEDRTLAGFQSRMISFAVRQYSMDIVTPELSSVLAHLAAKGGPADLKIPERLRAAGIKGGAKLSWQGRPVSMVCFNGPEAKTLYLFVIQDSALAAPAEPLISQTKGVAAAAWAQDGKTYFLAADLPSSDLQAYL